MNKIDFKSCLASVAYLLAWGFSTLLSILNLMAIWNLVGALAAQILVNIPTAVRVEKRIFPHLILSAVDRISILVLGVIAFTAVFIIENYYRKSSANAQLTKAFFRVTALQIGIFGVTILLILFIEKV